MGTGKTLGSEAALAEAATMACDALGMAPFAFAVVRLDGEGLESLRLEETGMEATPTAGHVVGRERTRSRGGNLAAGFGRRGR